jgi:hypothetical protein
MNYFELFHDTDNLSVALETNGKGFIGFILEMPGAFVRGKTESEALIKVNPEANSYLKWLGIIEEREFKHQVVQVHLSNLDINDADTEILLDADKDALSSSEFSELSNLVTYSGGIFLSLFEKSLYKDWVDESRIRKTFYGKNPKTIQEIFQHVNRTQIYYISRLEPYFRVVEEDFLKMREVCLSEISNIYEQSDNTVTYEADGEFWTLRKVLRRFIWHDRIHAKAITRILQKQKNLGLISEYKNPFFFNLT